MGWGSVNVLGRTSYVVDVESTVLGWGGDLLTFLVERLTLLMLSRQSWVGLGWGSVNVLGRTSYVVDVESTVLGWGGDLLTFLVGRLTLLMLSRRSWVGARWGIQLDMASQCLPD